MSPSPPHREIFTNSHYYYYHPYTLHNSLPLSAFISKSLEYELKKSKRRLSKHPRLAMSPHMLVGFQKQFLQGLLKNGNVDQSTILKLWQGLGSKAHQSLFSQNTAALEAHIQDTIFISFDMEWYEYDSTAITEIGVCMLDSRDLATTNRQSPFSFLSKMQTHHLRIKHREHLINGDLCAGYPDKFEFGTTTFTSIQSVREILQNMFVKYDENGYARPVVVLGHAIDNDYHMIQRELDIDLEALNTIVATVDTQVLAQEQGLAAPGRLMRLQHVLEHYGIHERHLHNAGNDAVATMLAAFLMTSPCTTSMQTPSYAPAYTHLKTTLSATNSPENPTHKLYGKHRYCPRCSSDRHTPAQCTRVLHCVFCAAHPHREHLATQHKSEKCRHEAKRVALERRQRDCSAAAKKYPVPCQACVESTDWMRNEGPEAYGHRREQCPWE